jgi:hypothetical protein
VASRQGTFQMYVDTDGLEDVRRTLDLIAKEDLNVAKRELRQGTKRIAEERLIPALHMGANSSGVPIAPALAKTARARTDRVVTVRIGAVNPKLSGFKRGKASKRGGRELLNPSPRANSKTPQKAYSQEQRTTLAFGSDRGPHPSNPVNHYGVPRSTRGHWVLPTVIANGTWESVATAYEELLNQLLRDYGEYR